MVFQKVNKAITYLMKFRIQEVASEKMIRRIGLKRCIIEALNKQRGVLLTHTMQTNIPILKNIKLLLYQEVLPKRIDNLLANLYRKALGAGQDPKIVGLHLELE